MNAAVQLDCSGIYLCVCVYACFYLGVGVYL